MIVVLGRPSIAVGPGGPRPAGLAAAIAQGIVAAGGRVELVGTVGDDANGDAVALGLARAGIGHAALLRVPAAATPVGGGDIAPPRLDASDVELGLRYLSDFRVLVVADDLPPDVAATASEAAAYSGAMVIVVLPAGGRAQEAPAGATVLEAPDDAEGPFAAAIGSYAVALESGRDPSVALREAVGRAGWEPVA
jgi:hypothetical protein